MANYCSVDGTITLKDEKQAEKLNAAIDAFANQKRRSLDFGGGVWLLDLQNELDKNEIRIFCDVKWALERDDMEKLVRWLGQFVPVTDMDIVLKYEEMGCQIIGRYELHDQVLTDFFIQEEEFPQYPEIKEGDDEDEIDDAYMDQLYAMLESAEGEVFYDFRSDCA